VNINVRPAVDTDRDRVTKALVDSYGSTVVVAHGTTYDAITLPTLVAEHAGELVGILTYQVDGDALEVVSIDAIDRHRGVGSALLAAATNEARERGCRRLWLVTSNDNLDALRFYQRRGLRIIAVDPGAIDRARAVKPLIPEIGDYNIPMHDEITLELRLD
jgi:ribosomal protein S18 acetylase RimI-like enzyme